MSIIRNGEQVVKPFFTNDGHIDVLFVEIYEKIAPPNLTVLSDTYGKKFRTSINSVLDSYGIVSIKDTVGCWQCDSEERKVIIDSRIDYLKKLVEDRNPGVIVFLGKIAAATVLGIDPKESKFFKYRFYNWKFNNKIHLCFVFDSLQKYAKDYLSNSREKEYLSKIYIASKGLGYNKPCVCKSLDFKEAKDYINYLSNEYKGFIAYDTETYSLNKVHDTRLGVMQFSTDTEVGNCILWDTDKSPYSALEKEELRPMLANLFSNPKNSFRGWVMFNAMFDMDQSIAEFNISFPRNKLVRDVQLMLHLLNENRLNKVFDTFDLKSGVKEFFGFTDYDEEAKVARSNGVLMYLNTDQLIKYAGTDPVCTMRYYRALLLWASMEGYKKKLLTLTDRLHNNGLRLYSAIQRNGFGVDKKHTLELLSVNSPINKRIAEIKEEYKKDPTVRAVNDEIYLSSVGTTKVWSIPFIFDMNKPSHYKQLFFDSEKGFKLAPVKPRKKKDLNPDGTYKKSIGENFQEAYKYTNHIVNLLSEEHGLKQLIHLYIVPTYKYIRQTTGDTSDGRVHPDIFLWGTVTGRLAFKNPNTQQLARDDTSEKKSVRAMMIALPPPNIHSRHPKYDYAIQNIDFCAAEMRGWGALSDDKNLCLLLRNSFNKGIEYRKNPDNDKLKRESELGGDIHKQTAALMFGVDLYSVDWDNPIYKRMRQATKSLSFGMIYMRGIRSIAAQIGKTEEEAQELQNSFFKKFPEGKRWIDNQQLFVRKYGYVESPFGRRRRLPGIFSDSRSEVQKAIRQAVNSPIQAYASDYSMYAGSLLQEWIDSENLNDIYQIVNTVHDSTVLQFIATYDNLKYIAEKEREIYTILTPKRVENDFGFHSNAPMDIDMEISYKRYKVCKKCGESYEMHLTSCPSTHKTKELDSNGNNIYEVCGCEDYEVRELNFQSYGYLNKLTETEEGFRNASLGFIN